MTAHLRLVEPPAPPPPEKLDAWEDDLRAPDWSPPLRLVDVAMFTLGIGLGIVTGLGWLASLR